MNDPEQYLKARDGIRKPKAEMIGIWSSHKGCGA